jgi:hypothetical protein
VERAQVLWRDGDPSDGACAPAGCAGERCNSSVNYANVSLHRCYCACGYAVYNCPDLAVTRAGSLLSATEGRKLVWASGDEGKNGDAWHDILLKRSTDTGATWSRAQIVMSQSAGWRDAAGHQFPARANVTLQNAELVVDKITGGIFLFATRNNSHVFRATSLDDGVSWSAAVDVSEEVKPTSLHWGWYATSFSSLQLRFNKEHKGRLVGCADHVLDQWSAYPIAGSHSHTLISDTHGKDWRVGRQPLALNSSNECSLAELANGTLVMNSRNYVGRPDPVRGCYIKKPGPPACPKGSVPRPLPCPASVGRTWCPSDPSAGQCDRPPRPACPPCGPSLPPKPNACPVFRYISHSYDGGESGPGRVCH